MGNILNFYWQMFKALCMFYGMYKFYKWASRELEKFIFTNKKIDKLNKFISKRLLKFEGGE